MELDWSVDRNEGASLVGLRVRNDGAVPRRVRIESRLDGPVLPPRRGGVPESGWDAAGVTAVIDPGEREAFGFAALAEPVEPPVELVGVESVDPDGGEARSADGAGESLSRAAVRDLEDHRPPRRAVAADRGGEDERGEEEDSRCETGADGGEVPTDRERDEAARERDGAARDPEDAEPTTGGDAGRSAAADPTPGGATPDEVDAWFAAVEARIERAERLDDADLATATAAVEAAGGLDAVGGLDERVAADAERLKAVRDRAAALAERAEESEVPTEALEALA
ncbi:hypothetical protein GLW36_05465 [Halorubrum terrestre]|uniref:DUF8080 domain-containing protein n=1 Tax=Halorubrum distributum TaxID=29283 RepID=A0A6B1IAF8_9EURY|nr:hypothetical protein [Halorubrum terrestre]MYL16099.1 hypothetical protein [Halorubrum terrestre]